MAFDNSEKYYEECLLCPRRCGVNRAAGHKGYCRQTGQMRISRAALHFWEEPCISGSKGSGAVFFNGCNLGCVFCQNYSISSSAARADSAEAAAGRIISTAELAEIMLDLQEMGANNINLVTGFSFAPSIRDSVEEAKKQGLNIPIVYNSSAYESTETLKMLSGIVDIYLPDLKYIDGERAGRYSNAENYFEIASRAIDEMAAQVGRPQFQEDSEGQLLMKKGVIIRHMLMPKAVREAKAVVDYVNERYGDEVYMSLMSQYTPISRNLKGFEEIDRRVTKREYDRLVEHAIARGMENVYIQDRHVASESFIPEFQ